MKSTIIIIVGILLLIGIIFATAQPVGPSNINLFNITISPRCLATNITVDIAAVNHTAEGYTNYEARLTAGRCERIIRDFVSETRLTAIMGAISSSINQTIDNTGFDFYPDRYSGQRGVMRTTYTIS